MLHTLKPAKGSRQNRKRVGRGNSSGSGTYSSRGMKGQHSRSGSTRRLGFEGGQTPLLRRQPKLGGFKNPKRVEYEAINLSDLETRLEEGSYTQSDLREKKLIRTKKPTKLLGRGALTKKITLEVHAASASAREAVDKAGGSVTIVTM